MRNDLSDTRDYGFVLGALMKRPTLIDNADYPLDKTDFNDQLHRILFVSIFNLYISGNVTVFNGAIIDSFLSNHQDKYNYFLSENGISYVDDLLKITEEYNFEYHYHRMRKFSLPRYRNC